MLTHCHLSQRERQWRLRDRALQICSRLPVRCVGSPFGRAVEQSETERALSFIIIDQTPICQNLPLIRGQGCHIEGKGLHFLTQHIGRDVLQIALKGFPIATKIGNLLLTGQNINLHGICGVPLTAVNTAEALLGTNRLIHAINTKYETDHGNLCK